MSFARTKIQPPRPRPGLLLPRPALEARLGAALATQRLVLVCAPAGYGKTALLGRAVEQLPADHATAWVALDEGDDVQRLLACLIAALEPLDPPWRSAPESLIALVEQQPAAVADMLVNTLEQCETAHGLIVLDDLHHLEDPAALALLERWLQHAGPRWTLALASRHEPALRLARLRAADEVAEFRQEQLRFDAGEVRALAERAGLDAATAERLHQRSDGWAAGLRLALNGGGQAGGHLDRQAFEFLSTEVLARIDPVLREFLLLTSVLTDLDAPRCAALTGDAQAARRLAEIERLGLFANVVDTLGQTLRLHDLFRATLQHRLALERPEQRLEMLARAALLESDPQRRQALLLAAGRLDEAARALLEAGPGLIVEGAVGSLLHLCAQFPAEFAAGSAELQQVSSIANWVIWNIPGWERPMLRAAQLYEARGDAGAALTAHSYHAAALVALGRLDEAGDTLDRLEAAGRRGTLPQEAANIAHVARSWWSLETGALHAVARPLPALMDALERQPRLEVWFFTGPPPRVTAARGAAAPMARWAAGALAIAGERPLPLRALALLTQSWLALWQGRLDAADELLRRCEEDVRWLGRLAVMERSHSLALRAMLLALNGSKAEAVAAARRRLDEHPASYGHWGSWHILFFAARVAAVCGDAVALRDWLSQMLDLQQSLPGATPARLAPGLPLQGRLAWLEGRAADAIAHWRAALAQEEAIDVLRQAEETRVSLAAALARQGEADAAAALLAPLLLDEAAEPGGALLAGPALAELAGQAWGARLPAAAQARLADWAALRRSAPPPPAAAAAPDGPAGVAEGLSARELDVLALIARGDSNKLIARQLALSPHTVKRHVANILEKLELGSRGQAAAWWRSRT